MKYMKIALVIGGLFSLVLMYLVLLDVWLPNLKTIAVVAFSSQAIVYNIVAGLKRK